MVIRVGELDVCGIPPVACRNAAGVEELHGGIVAHGVHEDGPVVPLRALLVLLARILQSDLQVEHTRLLFMKNLKTSQFPLEWAEFQGDSREYQSIPHPWPKLGMLHGGRFLL